MECSQSQKMPSVVEGIQEPMDIQLKEEKFLVGVFIIL